MTDDTKQLLAELFIYEAIKGSGIEPKMQKVKSAAVRMLADIDRSINLDKSTRMGG